MGNYPIKSAIRVRIRERIYEGNVRFSVEAKDGAFYLCWDHLRAFHTAEDARMFVADIRKRCPGVRI